MPLASSSAANTPSQSWKSSKKKRRVSRLPEAPPVIIQSDNAATLGLTAEEAKYMVKLNINNSTVKIDVHKPLRVLLKEDYNGKYGDKTNNSSQEPILSTLSKCKESIANMPPAKFKKISEYKIPETFTMPNSYIRFIERSSEELDGEVEYDMDEEDTVWLEIMNECRAKSDLPPVSPESFELLMDRLEKESYFLVQMNKEIDSSLAVIDEEAVCSICLDGECQNSNVILFCDMCNLAVHQDCYGVPYIPEGHWLCRRCLHSPSVPVDCVLCPNNGGAFKQTNRSHWAHVVCALWVPEVRFANTVFLEPIDSIEAIPAARWRLTCYICKQRGVGACIQCHKPNCFAAFHVTCAQQAGLYMNMETVSENNIGCCKAAVMVKKVAYCDGHTPPNAEVKPRSNKETADENMQNARKLLAKKRTSAPVISIPTIPPDRIQEIASLISVPKKAYFIQRLIGYWTLKRQFRNGVPLLRRLQTSHTSRRDVTRMQSQDITDLAELYRQLKYWQGLRQDLERVRLLCELVRKREKLKKEILKVRQEYLEETLTPFNSFLRTLLAELRQKDTGEIFVDPVDVDEVKDYLDVIKEPMDLQKMSEKVNEWKYTCMDQFETDFNLMINNCLEYNDEDTIFYKAGLKMKEQGEALLKQARIDLAALNLDPETGLITNLQTPPSKKESQLDEVIEAPVEEVQADEIDKQLAVVISASDMDNNDRMCKLLQILDQCELLKNPIVRNSRAKRIRVEISNLKRKLTRLSKTPARVSEGEEGDDEGEEEVVTEEKGGSLKEGRGSESGARKSLADEKEGGGKCAITKGIEKKVAFRMPTKKSSLTSRSSLRRLEQAKTPIIKPKLADTSVPVKRKRGRPPRSRNEELANSDNCFRMYRSSSGTRDSDILIVSNPADSVAARSESSSSGDSTSEECSCSEEECSCVSASSSEESQDEKKSDVISAEEMLQVVWAKTRGYPWFPALLINPKIPRNYAHNNVRIPSPPLDILQLVNMHAGPVYLVLFYDSKRTWQWLPRTKLQPLGMDEQLDNRMLNAKKPTLRKALEKAYHQALVHTTKDSQYAFKNVGSMKLRK